MWFCTFLEQTFEKIDSANSVLISDRDKGLITAIESCFPKAYPAHCCQHIADNIQSRYRAKCRPLF
jgi:transposase-like protein